MTTTIKHYHFDGVAPTGELPNGDMVPTEGEFSVTRPEGGCGDPLCGCSSHSLTQLFPRSTDGHVFGYKLTFDSRDELDRCLQDLPGVVRTFLH